MSSSVKKSAEKMPKSATPEPAAVKSSDSPAFVAEWSDGTTTRMSTYTILRRLNLKRGVALIRAAYASRKKIPMAMIEATIVEARFEKEGVVVRAYAAEDLTKAVTA
jgi:hypothetical protein